MGCAEGTARRPRGHLGQSRTARRFHFETGRALAERLGYSAAGPHAIPAAAVEFFAGVGYVLDLAAIQPGETVLHLGSGSGTDSFVAAFATARPGASSVST